MVAPSREKETVVLVHGLGRSRLSLWPLQRRLEREGFVILNFPYAPTFQRFDVIVDNFHGFLRDRLQTSRYHLVGHSLGNIIIRGGFLAGYGGDLGCVVMLAPPNQRPLLAHKLHRLAPFRIWAGDCGQRLASESFYATLPRPDVPFGVIAGSAGQRFTFDEPIQP